MVQKKSEQLTKERIVQVINFIVLLMVTINFVLFIVLLTIQYVAVLYQEQPDTLGETKNVSIIMGGLLALVNILAGVLIAYFISVARRRWNKIFKKIKK
ncbi:hypothetical protein SFC81_00160 [Enterococcus faecalis]